MLSLLLSDSAVKYYLPIIASILGVFLTFISGMYLGVLKHREDRQSNANTADASLRDDLLELVNHYEAQLKNKDDFIEKESLAKNKAQQSVFDLMTEKTKLEIDNLRLRAEASYLKDELGKIERKVFYIKEVTENEPKSE